MIYDIRILYDQIKMKKIYNEYNYIITYINKELQLRRAAEREAKNVPSS